MTFPVIDYYLMSSFVLLLFLPGIFLVAFLSKRFNLSLTLPEILVLGSVFWTAILVGPSVLLGLFSRGVLWYFVVFTIGSVATMVGLGPYLLVKKLKEGSLGIHIGRNPQSYLVPIYLLLIWFFIFLMTIYSAILLDWDPLTAYLPMAKAIVLTGNLTYNPYMLSETAMAYTPLLPIIYAWSIFFTNGLYLRFLPMTFFLLTTLVTWQLTKMIGGNGSISVMVFSSMMSVQMLVALNGLYLDLAFIFYASVSIYLVSRVLFDRSHRIFWYLSLGLTCSLDAMTSEEGVIMLFLIFSFLLLCLVRNMAGRLTFTLLTALPFILMFSIDLYLGWYPVLILGVFVVIFTLSIALFYLSSRLAGTMASFPRRESIKGMVLFSVACIPAALFYARNLLLLGVFTARWPPFKVSLLYALGFNQSSSTGAPDPTVFFQWNHLFLAAGLAAPYIVPVIVGFFLLLRFKPARTDRGSIRGTVSIAILAWFITLLMMWSIVFQTSYAVTEYRRLTYFASFFSLLASIGASAVYERSRLGKYASVIFVLSNAVVLFYIWNYRWNLQPFFSYLIFETNPIDILVFSSAFLVPILFLDMIHRLNLKLGNKSRFSKKLPAVFILSTLVVSCYVPVYMISLTSVQNLSRIQGTEPTWDPNYYNSANAMWFWGPVIDFYNTHCHDDFVTVGFWNDPIIVFANRTYISVDSYWGFEFLIPFLLLNDTNTILKMLYSESIRYFIVPTPDCLNPSFYYEYIYLSQRYLLFRMIAQDPHFILYGVFENFYLYKLMG